MRGLDRKAYDRHRKTAEPDLPGGYGFAERKILFFDSFFSVWLVYRDTQLALYWSAVSSRAFSLVACLFVAIAGWPAT